LANDLSGETEGNVPCLHKKSVTHNHVLHETLCGTLALGGSPDLWGSCDLTDIVRKIDGSAHLYDRSSTMF
jgi:hypothetical protein